MCAGGRVLSCGARFRPPMSKTNGHKHTLTSTSPTHPHVRPSVNPFASIQPQRHTQLCARMQGKTRAKVWAGGRVLLCGARCRRPMSENTFTNTCNKHVHHPPTCPFARPTQTHRSTHKHMHTSPPATLPHARPSVHAHTNTRPHNVAHGCKGRPKRAGGTVGGRAAPRGSRLRPRDLRRR